MSDPELRRDRTQRQRAVEAVGIARHGRLPRSRAWATVVRAVAAGLAVVLVSTVGVAGIWFYQFTNGVGKNSVDINGDEAAPLPEIGAYEGGFNILVVGSDAYSDRDTVLNDVNILVHVSADQTSAVAVSIPRDMVVPFPGCISEKTGKTWGVGTGLPINNALFYGWLPCVVNVVKNFTGLEIQYAAMIGFDGVANMSNAVGGVTVCLTAPIDDRSSGLQLEAGTHTLQGWVGPRSPSSARARASATARTWGASARSRPSCRHCCGSSSRRTPSPTSASCSPSPTSPRTT